MRILVIEDDDALARGLARTLRDEGFTVDTRGEGVSGLAQALTGRYDLVIVDLMLPGMNGFRACKAIRDAGQWVPVMILSAKDGEYDEAEGLEIGADDYLVKPVSTVVLLARIRALLRRPQRRVDWPRAGDVVLDPVRRRCRVGDADADLTAREAEVLAFLLANPGVVHTKGALLDAVWGADFSGDPNIVEVYISHLRRKIDEPFDRRSIETVRGEGDRFRVDTNP